MEALLVPLEQGATLITANQRLARHLHQEFGARQIAQGRRVWPSADILPLSAWLQRAWNEYLDAAIPSASLPILLSAAQSLALWARVIGESEEGQGLLHVPATARSAAEAWRLSKQYRLPPLNRYPHLNDDTRAFARWAQRYAQLCAKAGWLDRDGLADFVAERVREGVLPVPARVLLAGFDEYTPQQRHLFDTLRAMGAEVTEVGVPVVAAPKHVRLALADADGEIRAAAQWARALLSQSDGSIAVVVPDLQAVRGRIERVFTEVLAPARSLTGESAASLVNISLGRPLAEAPLVADALLLLGLARGVLPLEDMSRLLRSPFSAGAEQEMTRRARLDAQLRETGAPEITLQAVIRLAEREGVARCPLLVRSLAALRDAAFTGRLSPTAWAERFSRWLALMGWPGERALSSEEHQATVAWRALLAGFGALDVVTDKQALSEALGALRRLAADTVFQPQQEGARVQVLGVLEAAGLQFDHLWVLGLHDEVWPPPPRPHAFLPLALQRDHGLPHASAERELAFCRRMTGRLLSSAAEVVVSHPRREGDRELKPSALIADVSAGEPMMPSVPVYAELIQSARRLEAHVDDIAPALPAAFVVRGGAGVFKHQAACPFRAFSVLRLGAVALGEAQVGLSPQERGTLVHEALDLVWQRLRSHAELVRMSDEAVQALTDEVAQTAVRRAAAEQRAVFTPAFTRLEQRRLAELLRQWLALEKSRSPFEVLERERAHTLAIGGLTVNARIDRVDRLADGRCVIIDYKTGVPSDADWFGPRPEEPQLPLYAVALGQPLGAVLFGQVVRGDTRFRGVAASEGVAPGIKLQHEHREARVYASWEAMIADWQAVLTRLAEDFRTGHAAVDPKDVNACRYCDCAPLCRIHDDEGAPWGGGND